ncbi:hypothetical protein [Marinoscillum sp. MHG1-6]|uniref:hypothetical protein n=1 Tax=Marinoscillum sp. MHG1-6 TaxID=2959627 RepID=UPI0021577A1B|nr:hypothetical protein [Marinoscillum sp. MHG1-6]
MLKNLTLILLLSFPIVLFAQDDSYDYDYDDDAEDKTETNNFLPQEGDWGLSISAQEPLLLVGNLFSATNTHSALWQFPSSPVFVVRGKLFTASDFAFRAGAQLFFSSNTAYSSVADDDPAATADDYLDDEQKIMSTGVTLLFGIEKRKGNNRVQGFYGADVFVGYGYGSKYTYNYANDMTTANQTPSSTGWFNPVAGNPTPVNAYRILEAKTQNSYSAGVQGFIGVEVFLFPKVSLGGNFTWGIRYDGNTATSGTWEEWDATANAVEETTIETKNGSSITAGIDNAGGDVSLNFYF